MADTQDEGGSDEEQTPTTDQTDTGANQGGATEETDTAAGDTSTDDGDEADAGDDGAGDEKPPAKKDGDSGDDNTPPPTRKTVKERTPESDLVDRQSHIIDRKNRKIERLTKKGAQGEGSGDGKGSEDIDSKVNAAVQQALSPHIETLQQNEDEKEADAYLTQHPQFKQFREKALKLWKHPSRAALPADTVFAEAAGGTRGLLKLGAKLGTKADEDQSREGAGGGHQPSDGSERKGVWKQTPDEFKAQQEAVRHGRKE